MEKSNLPDPVSIPLTFDGDGFILDVQELDSARVQLLRIIRYPGNQNSTPVLDRVQDLDQATLREIAKQINRKFPGRRVFAT